MRSDASSEAAEEAVAEVFEGLVAGSRPRTFVIQEVSLELQQADRAVIGGEGGDSLVVELVDSANIAASLGPRLPQCSLTSPPRTPGPSSPTATQSSPATRPPSTLGPTRRPSPDGPARSRPTAPPLSLATPPRPGTSPAGSPPTTSARSSPASETCATSSATPPPPRRQPSTTSSGSRSITFRPGQAKIRAEVTISPEKYVEHAEQCGDTGRVRGGTDPVSPHCSMCYSAEVDLQQTDGPYAL